MIRELRPWTENLGKRLVKAPKVYGADSGLVHSLLNIPTRRDLDAHPKLGASWEGFMIAQLTRRLRAARSEVYFWATHAGAELDLMIVRGRERLGFEIKRTDAPRVTPSMRFALEDLKLSRLYAVHAGRTSFEYDPIAHAPPDFSEPVPGYYDDVDCMVDLGAIDAEGRWHIDYAADGLGNWQTFDPLRASCPDEVDRPECLRGAQFFAADFDGDGRADLSVKASSGKWHVDFAANGFGGRTWDATYLGFGDVNSIAVPADYDGDRVADMATKSSDGYWRIDESHNGRNAPAWDTNFPGFGGANFVPVPADYDGDGHADLATRDGDNWYVDRSRNGRAEPVWDEIHGGYDHPDRYVPAPADYDGDDMADLASQTPGGFWLVDYAKNGCGAWDQHWDPYVRVAAGATVDDLAREFDAFWMSPRAFAALHDDACSHLCARSDSSVWFINERFTALARMYRKTGLRHYAALMHRYATCMRDYRDDRHPGMCPVDTEPRPESNPLDEIRGRRGLPGDCTRSARRPKLTGVASTSSTRTASAAATPPASLSPTTTRTPSGWR